MRCSGARGSRLGQGGSVRICMSLAVALGVSASFQGAIALDPRNAEAHHQYGFLLLMVGANGAGLDELKRALELEPERAISLATSAFERRLTRRDDEALTLLDSALVLEPGDAAAADRLRPNDYRVEAEAALAAAEFRSGEMPTEPS